MLKLVSLIFLLAAPVFGRDVDPNLLKRPFVRKVIRSNLSSIRARFFSLVEQTSTNSDVALGLELLDKHMEYLFKKLGPDATKEEFAKLKTYDEKIKSLQSMEIRKKFINAFMLLEKLKFLSLIKGSKSSEYEKTSFVLRDSYLKIFEDLTEKNKLKTQMRICFQDFISYTYRISYEKEGFEILKSNVDVLSRTLYDFVHTLSILDGVAPEMVSNSKTIRSQWNLVLKNIYKRS